jgi:hypothetical protein
MSDNVQGKRGKRKGHGHYHPCQALRDNAIVMTDEESIEFTSNWLLSEAETWKDGCEVRTGAHGKRLKCKCLDFFIKEDYGKDAATAVARYILMFSKKKHQDQQHIVMEWIRYKAGKQGPIFFLPFIAEDDDTQQMLQALNQTTICQSATMKLLDFQQWAWATCTRHVEKGTIPLHGNSGQQHRRKSFESKFGEGLTSYFEVLRQYAEPIATRFVRSATDNDETRDDDDEVEYLPSHFSKRNLYYRYGFENGWNVSADSKGRESATPREGQVWMDSGLQRNDIASWFGFRSFWDNNYFKIRVHKPSHDVCDECFKFRHRHQALVERIELEAFEAAKAVETINDAAALLDDPEIGDLVVNDDGEIDLDGLTFTCLPCSASEPQKELEQATTKMSRHVQNASVQRDLVNEKMAKSRADANAQVPHIERTFTFVADYMQNMSLPYFGGEQPGETYYLSPETIYLFGVVEEFTKENQKTTLHANIYSEQDGKKGGNNVASQLWYLFRHLGLLDASKGAAQELNVIMDNCFGQNKNKMVLRLAPLLVELGFFKRVNFIFLIVGHTKNICDRMFNIAKLLYRGKNMYTLAEIIATVGKHAQVTVHIITPEIFKDFDLFNNQFFRGFEKIGVAKWHVFTCELNDKQEPVMTFEESNLDDALVESMNMHKRSNKFSANTRGDRMESLVMKTLTRPGLADIKQVDLYRKFREYVPEYAKDITCPKPPDEMIRKIAKMRSDKSRDKAHEKKRVAAATQASNGE